MSRNLRKAPESKHIYYPQIDELRDVVTDLYGEAVFDVFSIEDMAIWDMLKESSTLIRPELVTKHMARMKPAIRRAINLQNQRIPYVVIDKTIYLYKSGCFAHFSGRPGKTLRDRWIAVVDHIRKKASMPDAIACVTCFSTGGQQRENVEIVYPDADE